MGAGCSTGAVTVRVSFTDLQQREEGKRRRMDSENSKIQNIYRKYEPDSDEEGIAQLEGVRSTGVLRPIFFLLRRARVPSDPKRGGADE